MVSKISFILGLLLLMSYIQPNAAYAYGIDKPIYYTSYSSTKVATSGYTNSNPIVSTSYTPKQVGTSCYNPVTSSYYGPTKTETSGYSPKSYSNGSITVLYIQK